MLQAVPLSSLTPKLVHSPLLIETPKPDQITQNIKISEIAKEVWVILSNPGSPEFYQHTEKVLTIIAIAGGIGSVLYYLIGKPDSSGLSGIICLTGALSSHLAGQVAISKSIQEKLEKMESLNHQQAAQITHYQTLFKEFKRDIEDLKEFSVEHQEELKCLVSKLDQQIQASGVLLEKLFKDGILQDILKAIKDIKDPEGLLRRLNELEVVTKKLQDSQKELANTEGRLEIVVANLREMEKEHQDILFGHRQVLAVHKAETDKLQAAVAAIIV